MSESIYHTVAVDIVSFVSNNGFCAESLKFVEGQLGNLEFKLGKPEATEVEAEAAVPLITHVEPVEPKPRGRPKKGI